jgi:hypothetical protein
LTLVQAVTLLIFCWVFWLPIVVFQISFEHLEFTLASPYKSVALEFGLHLHGPASNLAIMKTICFNEWTWAWLSLE